MKLKHIMEKIKKENLEQKASETEETAETEKVEIADTEKETPEAESEAVPSEPENEEPAADAMAEAKEKLQEMGEKLVEIQDKYTRLYAEFENYRRRTSQEKIELQLGGHKEMVKAILPVVDDMERALTAMGEESEAKEGVKLIYDKLLKTLEQKGVKQMQSVGEVFDADLHEAVTQIPATEEEKKNKIIDEIQKGYYLNDKVLRHAKVVVAV